MKLKVGLIRAQVAELVDALASGASGLKAVEVRVFSWAPVPFFHEKYPISIRISLGMSLRSVHDRNEKMTYQRAELYLLVMVVLIIT